MSRNRERADPGLRLMNGLGLAARAGRLRIGADAVTRSIRRGDAKAVVVAGDAATAVVRRFTKLVRPRSTPHRVVLDGARLGRAVGRSRVVVMAITDESLARRVMELAEEVEVQRTGGL